MSNKDEAGREVSASQLGQIQKFKEIKKEVYEPQIERLGETKKEQYQRTQGQ